MSDKIALLLSIQDTSLLAELKKLISEDKLLSILAENSQIAFEFISVTDNEDYDYKENETVIFTGDSENKKFISCAPEAALLKSAIRRAYCLWETVNMNKSACNSVQKHGKSLAKIAKELTWKTQNSKKTDKIRLAVADQLPIATVVVDLKGIVSFLNKQAQKLFQSQGVYPLGKPINEAFPLSLQQFLSKPIEETHISMYNCEVSVRKATLILNEQKAGYIISFITD